MGTLARTRKSRVCKSCKIEKPIDEFHKYHQKMGGYRAECKECRKEKS